MLILKFQTLEFKRKKTSLCIPFLPLFLPSVFSCEVFVRIFFPCWIKCVIFEYGNKVVAVESSPLVFCRLWITDLVTDKIFSCISVPSVGLMILFRCRGKKVPTTKAPCFVTETNSEVMQKSLSLSHLLYCALHWLVRGSECLGGWTLLSLFSFAVSTLPFATPVLSPDEIPEDNERDTSNREWQTNTTNSYVSESRGQAKEESDFQLFLCHFYYHQWWHWANRWQQ